jgi:hypothetical protein
MIRFLLVIAVSFPILPPLRASLLLWISSASSKKQVFVLLNLIMPGGKKRGF